MGCVAETSDVTAPKTAALAVSTGDEGSISCDVAVRLSAEEYRTRKQSVEIPTVLADYSTGTVKFVLFAWRDEQTSPTRIVACQIPNSIEALAYFDDALAKASDQSAAASTSYKSLHSRSKTSVGNEHYVDVQEGECPQGGLIDYGCSCSASSCTGWNIEKVAHFDPSSTAPASVPGTNEPEKVEALDGTLELKSHRVAEMNFSMSRVPDTQPVNVIIDGEEFEGANEVEGMTALYNVEPGGADPPPTSLPIIICGLDTDYPHGSYYLNVHGWWQCTHPMPSLSVEVNIQYKSCLFWPVCWWTTAPNPPGWKGVANARYVEDNHATACIDGEWRGRVKGKFISPPDYTPSSWHGTINGISVIRYCPPPPI